MAHQALVKNIAKTEFLLGLAALLVDTIGIEIFQHMQEKLATIWVNLETMKAFLKAFLKAIAVHCKCTAETKNPLKTG